MIAQRRGAAIAEDAAKNINTKTRSLSFDGTPVALGSSERDRNT
jgi:hypothetical protein